MPSRVYVLRKDWELQRPRGSIDITSNKQRFVTCSLATELARATRFPKGFHREIRYAPSCVVH
eukprot:3953599-Amphidinium_carterae.1